MQPKILNFSDLTDLKQQHPELIVHDQISLFIDELFDIEFPAKKDSKNSEEVAAYSREITEGNEHEWGHWVYYPWNNTSIHIPPKDDLRRLRTSRNRNLITSSEQSKLYEATILVAGMSVGSNIIEALVSQGIGGKLLLADMDIIEPSNLNRIRSPLQHVGLHKVQAISQKIWEIDPFIEIIGYQDGVNEEMLQGAIQNHKIDIIVDEVDSLEVKVQIREIAMQHSLPVLMAADDGDDALLDIERYDMSPQSEMFNGRIPGEVIERIKSGNIERRELGFMIGKYFVGPENIPVRMYESLHEIGKTLPSWPQLGGAAALSGITIAYAVKKILLAEKIRDGRVLVSLDEKLSLQHEDPTYLEKLQKYQSMMFGEQPHATE